MISDGRPYGIKRLQLCLIDAAGLPLEVGHGDEMKVTSGGDVDTEAIQKHPYVTRNRLVLAANEALLDLVSLGIAIPVANAPDQTRAHPVVESSGVRIPYQLASRGSSVAYQANLAAYRLAPRLVDDETPWFLDPDLFTADIEQLQLDRRTRRCLVEALAAYRHGNDLACGSLLGATSEGAWYAAGEQLRSLDDQLDRALDDDNTAKVQARVSEVLRQHGLLKATVYELRAHAAVLRQLRNYGVHPRSDDTDSLEHYLSDSGAAMLLMESYSCLTRLADAVTRRLA